FFARRGITVSAGVLVAAISSNAVQAAPMGLSALIMTTATKGVAASGSTLALIKTTLAGMALTKAKIAVLALTLVLAAGAATFLVSQNLMDDGRATRDVGGLGFALGRD